MANRRDDWARQVPWTRGHGPYEDYGWESGQSIMPEFRDPSVHEYGYDWEHERRGGGPARGGYRSDRDFQGTLRRAGQNYNQQLRGMSGQGSYGQTGYGPAMYGPTSGPHVGRGPKGYRRSDERIHEDVCDRLLQHGRLDARDIEVETRDGEVYLRGTVDSRRDKRLAEDIADSVSGVRDIHNELRVSPTHSQGTDIRSGAGRRDYVGGSGVYPASGPWPEGNAEMRGEAGWGQGERGAQGYQDSGRSETWYTKEELRDIKEGQDQRQNQ